MCSISVRIVQPVYGQELKNKGNYELFENMLEGRQVSKKRWADIDDIFNDFMMTQRLLKCLIAHEVDVDLWKNKYNAKWAGKAERPLPMLKWNKQDDL